MMAKRDLVMKLQQDILLWQGFKPATAGNPEQIGLGAIEQAFPGSVFPKRAIHEFITVFAEDAAASDGFIAGLLAVLMQQGSPCLWISTSRRLYPPSLSSFNVEPERIIFMDVKSQQDALWITEEALKCEGLAAVVAEIDALGLVESRRLQLAVEQSGVTGFILRKSAKQMANTIATARWHISPLSSVNQGGMPGVGFPRWQVDLLKVRNGVPGRWVVEWAGDGFLEVSNNIDQNNTAPDVNWSTQQRRQIG